MLFWLEGVLLGAYTILQLFHLCTRKFSLDFRGSCEHKHYIIRWQHGAETCEIILNKIHSETAAASSRRRSANRKFLENRARDAVALLENQAAERYRVRV